jgi:hypothetical protein
MTKEDKTPKSSSAAKSSSSNNEGASKGKHQPASKKDKASSGGGDKASEAIKLKYNKLKKKHRYLRDEYSRVLESWEMVAKQNKVLAEERK